jgi:hypothetical protein
MLRTYARRLDREQRQFGAYPREYDVVDYYGFSVFYVSDGKSYMLVSFGKDGRADRKYDITRITSIERADNCFNVDADSVVINNESRVRCLK